MLADAERIELPGPCPHCGYCYGVVVADLARSSHTDKPMLLKCGRRRKTVATDPGSFQEEGL